MRYMARLATAPNYASTTLDESIRIIHAVAFEDRYAEWFEYIKSQSLPVELGIEFFEDDDSYKAFVDENPDFWEEVYRLDDLEIETIGKELGDAPVFYSIIYFAYKPKNHPAAPLDYEDSDRKKSEEWKRFVKELDAGIPHISSFFPELHPLSFTGKAMSQKVFALLIRSGFTMEEVFRVCSLLHTYPGLKSLETFNLIEGISFAGKVGDTPEFVQLATAYGVRMRILTSYIERATTKSDIEEIIEQEGKDNKILTVLYRLLIPAYLALLDNRGNGVRNTVYADTFELFGEQDGIADFLALSHDDLAYVFEVADDGVPASDIHANLDCIESYRDAYEAGVPAEDLYA